MSLRSWLLRVLAPKPALVAPVYERPALADVERATCFLHLSVKSVTSVGDNRANVTLAWPDGEDFARFSTGWAKTSAMLSPGAKVTVAIVPSKVKANGALKPDLKVVR